MQLHNYSIMLSLKNQLDFNYFFQPQLPLLGYHKLIFQANHHLSNKFDRFLCILVQCHRE